MSVDQKEKLFLQLVESYLHVPLSLFDVGTYQGEYADLLLKFANPKTVHLFEPNPTNFSFLTSKYAGASNVICSNLALGRASTKQEFYVVLSAQIECQPSELSSLVMRPIFRDCSRILVDVETLDNYAKAHDVSRISFIKIDTEGNELSVLEGARGLLERRAIDFMQFEYGGTYIDAGTTLAAVARYLQSFGYSIYDAVEGKLVPLVLKEDFQYNNFLATHLAPGVLPWCLV